MDTPLKKTALTALHTGLGAKMVPFAGYEMPVRYFSDIEEHQNIRQNVGVFDVSHMGEFLVRGSHALELIQKVTSNDASKLFDGKAQYSCLPNETGGIVDDLLVYRLAPEEYLLVVNASNIEKDWEWIGKWNTMGAEMVNISDETSLLAVQGPAAMKVLQKLTDLPLDQMEYYTFRKSSVAGVAEIIVSATGYTGAGGFELYIPQASTKAVWDALFEAGADVGIRPAGLACRDTLRLEMGFCLYGNDIDDTTSPLEAGLGWITKLNKDFVGAGLLRQQKETGLTRKLCGLRMHEKGIPRAGYRVLNAAGEPIGHLTSGTQAPSLGYGIAMGYLATGYNAPGTEVMVEIRNKMLKAEVVKMPFYVG